MSRIRARATRELGLQMVFQDPYSALNPRRRVKDQIADSLRIARVPEDRWQERIEELLDQVGLPANAARSYPHEFSGGQRQRLCVARVLAVEPSVIVADEPISALDASTQASVSKLLLRLSRELGVGLLFISHDLAIVRQIADTVTVMYLGRVVETAPAAALWERPHHPYSEALIGAVPRADGSNTLPQFLPGEVPDPAAPPTGCRFHPRCPMVMDRCRVTEPGLDDLDAERRVACFLHSDRAVGAAAPGAAAPGAGGR